ncbi:lysine decarboxylase [Pelistega indica]|uniref:Cytokinin riboside 5'-monophosphate phosphoribohydrolase n=1 Tax=Pelistega indica TaxID=1414851 RepID=V8FU78_9BURK|nr:MULTISPECIES: TIGR00730 family Rossman fold protein [Pelistega]ETD67273.1 lysine decarboxylase [Pelistega indica]
MNNLKNITVYCGSNFGEIPDYYEEAKRLGELMAKEAIQLVYGGGKIGLMGALANSVLQHNGTAIGIMPTFLKNKEMAHTGLTELIETPTMSIRKDKMMEMADGFIAMAGGIGTYEELFEVFSALQLKQHTKPVGLLNVKGFFDPLLTMLESTAKQGFMPLANMNLLCVADNAGELIEKMRNFQFVDVPKWVTPKWVEEMRKGV